MSVTTVGLLPESMLETFRARAAAYGAHEVLMVGHHLEQMSARPLFGHATYEHLYAADGSPARAWSGHDQGVTALRFSPSGTWLSSAGRGWRADQ